MKHATSRFLRFFLVAALVAAMAGSLMPTKVVGQATGTVVTPDNFSVLSGAGSWTIAFDSDVPIVGMIEADDTVSPAIVAFAGTTIALTFPSGTTDIPADDTTTDPVTRGIATSAVSIQWEENGEMMSAEPGIVASDGSVVTLTPADGTNIPAGRITVAISADASIDNIGTPGAQSLTIVLGDDPNTTETPTTPDAGAYTTTNQPAVTLSSANAGATAQWKVEFQVTEALTADVHEITLEFSNASVPSSIDRSAISVRNTTTGDTRAALLTVAPVTSPNSITFFTPLGLAAANAETGTIIISTTAGVAHKTTPKASTVKVTAGDNAVQTSDDFMVEQYLNISPRMAPRGSTVTVTGGGFTPGTSGSVMVGGASVGGTYTVDSKGALSGSFVTSMGTSGGGAVSVMDLGSGNMITGPTFSQLASASPASTEVALGSTLSVSLFDFDMGSEYTATIAGNARDFSVSSGKGTLTITQGEGTGTKRVEITGQVPAVEAVEADPDADPPVEAVEAVEASTPKKASFLITIVSRTLTVSPSSAVPGQAVTVSGSGFNGIATVDLTLTGGGLDDAATGIDVTTAGTFLYTGRVPFTDDTADAGSKTWTATGMTTAGAERSAGSSGFSIQKRAITLSPSTANPGATVEVYGSGWGVKTAGNATTSQVTLSVTGTNATFGPFPISSSGEFTGAFTVPADAGVSKITVTAMDNNGTDPLNTGLTQGFPRGTNDDDDGNQSATASLAVPTGVIQVTPATASTGTVITVTGQGFPSQTNLSALSFGDSNALPVPAPATDVSGSFTVTLTVPAAAQGGSLTPGAVVITARVGQISGTTTFTIPGPEITLGSNEARPGESISISGTGFSAFSNVDTINVGQRNQVPTPTPLTDGVGDFSASVIIPALNPGAYTITVRTGSAFTATASIRILSSTVGSTVPAEIAFQALTSRGILELAAAAPPGGTMFGAYVPDLAGNTLVNVEPNGVLILTLNADARVSVSGQPAVDVMAGTPTFFALGSVVSIEVVE